VVGASAPGYRQVHGGRGLTAVGGHTDELASGPESPHDKPIRNELPADHVDVDPVHLRRLGDLVISQCRTAMADNPEHLATSALSWRHTRQYGGMLGRPGQATAHSCMICGRLANRILMRHSAYSFKIQFALLCPACSTTGLPRMLKRPDRRFSAANALSARNGFDFQINHYVRSRLWPRRLLALERRADAPEVGTTATQEQ
jgi:hypothetical protein